MGGTIIYKFEAQRQKEIRDHNMRSVLKIIQSSKGDLISRADIARSLYMSATSITRIISALIKMNLIKQFEPFSTGVGRNGISLKINADAFYCMGFAIDRDYLKVTIINFDKDIVAEKICRLPTDISDIDVIIARGKEIFTELCESNAIDPQMITGMGISCCGNVDQIKGISRFSPQFQWENVDVKTKAESVFGIPVSVDNDDKMALYGAMFQSDELVHSDVVYLSIGSGVGLAAMYNGSLARGINNAAGEIGHTMFSLNGRLCSCGKRGCLSAYISETGILRECRFRGHELTGMDELMSLYHAGEPWAVPIVKELIVNIATTFSNMIYTYNPEYLLVGGNMIVDFPEIFRLAKEECLRMTSDKFHLKVEIKRRSFKNNEALGAAYVAQEAYIGKLLDRYGTIVE